MESLDSRNKEFIHGYYRDMVNSYSNNDNFTAISFFNTLYKAGYLKNIKIEERDEKIDQCVK